MLKRKSQGLSINTIILAVIGLIILVVLVAMLTGRLGGLGKGIQETSTCDEFCKAAGYGGKKAVSVGGKLHSELKDSEGTVCECET